MTRYSFDVSYRLDRFRCGSLDKEIQQIVGQGGDSGSGFGYRDLTFDFYNKERAMAARERIAADPRVEVTEIWENAEGDDDES